MTTFRQVGRVVETGITKEGQEYYDRPIYIRNKPNMLDVPPTPAAAAVASIFGRELGKVTVRIPNKVRHTRLRWMKPDGKGGLVPR